MDLNHIIISLFALNLSQDSEKTKKALSINIIIDRYCMSEVIIVVNNFHNLRRLTAQIIIDKIIKINN